jgi:hypothetical protein
MSEKIKIGNDFAPKNLSPVGINGWVGLRRSGPVLVSFVRRQGADGRDEAASGATHRSPREPSRPADKSPGRHR